MRLFPTLFGFVAAIVTSSLPHATAAPPHGLRLMTYNVNFGNAKRDGVLEAIVTGDADIVLLQEVTATWRAVLRQRFADQYPHQVYRIDTRSAGGLAVLSRLPIATEQLLPTPHATGAWFPAERIVVDSAFGALQILNVHLRPALDRGSWVRGYLTTPIIRLREIAEHWKTIATDLPTIVAGDFNELPSGDAIAFLVQQGLIRVPTTGPRTWRYEVEGNTGVTELLRLDIDHVMIDRRLAATDARVLDAGTSDHRPVVVTLVPTS